MNTSPSSITRGLAATLCTAAGAALLAVPLHAQGPCESWTLDALRSCRQNALSDLLKERAKCANHPTVAQIQACDREAMDAYRAALASCDEQHAARLDTCARLGGGIYQPLIDPRDFGRRIDNPFFPLVPGTTFVYLTHTADGLERDEFEVTHRTRRILGVTCVEVEDSVTLDGELTEHTFDWFTQDGRGAVWYFGELSMQLTDGRISGLEGSWEAGQDGASPGVVMEAHPALGDFYRQEFLIDEAEDVAGVVSLSERVHVPFGSFKDCLETEDFSPLDPGATENKFFVRGVGDVLEVDLTTGDRTELVKIEHDDD